MQITKLLLLLCVLAVCLQYAGMPAVRCARCDKFCYQKKNRSQVGSSVYLREYLKVEKGLTDEELNDRSCVICTGCRSFIFDAVQRPEHCKKNGDPKRALPETDSAVEAARKKLKSDEQFHVKVSVPGKYKYFLMDYSSVSGS